MSFILFFVALVIAGVAFAVYASSVNSYWKKQLAEKSKLIKDAEAQMIHMEKMASIGTLAAGIAHEINNPLGFLISNLQSLKEYTPKFADKLSGAEDENKIVDDFKAITQESLDGALRIKRIVSDLRTFSRRSETQKLAVDMNQLLETVMAIVWNEIKYKVTVVKDYQAKTPILGDPTQLSQVYLNLLINASQAIAEKGSITINTYEDAQYVYTKISDTGSGIAPEVLPKIFDPFFSTKKSTGLGLSVSYNIIKHHGGEVNVESKVGVGTAFLIQLPKGT
jgi:two-component system, NtrC family, sensor kinase